MNLDHSNMTFHALSFFSTKRAEDEPWLMDGSYYLPPDYQFMVVPGSVIIYGSEGAGKTALSFALEKYARSLNYIIVRWKPRLINNKIEQGSKVAFHHLEDILSLCGSAIIEFVFEQTESFLSAPIHVQEYLIWFLRSFSREEIQDVQDDTRFTKIINELLTDDFRDSFEESPIIGMEIVYELTAVLKEINIPGVWVLVDGLESLCASSPKLLSNNLEIFLSTLEFFEEPSFSYKFTLPLDLETNLMSTSAVMRHRIDGRYSLVWESNHLRSMMETRLSIAIGAEIDFEEIYDAVQLTDWLTACAGYTPRSWLNYFRPIVAKYWENLSSNVNRRLKNDEWIAARERSAPYITFDDTNGTVTIGQGEPRSLSPEVLAIFKYLLTNQGKVCTKGEIYKHAYLPYISSTEERDKDTFILPEDYEDLINTAIYRLRNAIEPIPKYPVFITTIRNQGIKLNTIAFR